MQDVLTMTMTDGSVWEADARPLAEDRANYYTKIDGLASGSEGWEEEVQFALADSFTLSDWVKNNMDWADLKARMVKPPSSTDYQELFLEAEMEVARRE